MALTPPVASAQIKFVQANSAVPTSTATLSATYASAQTAGTMNIVVIGWDSGSITVSSVTDTSGNRYQPAAKYANTSVGISQSIYYASNIAAAAAGANKVTVKLSSKSAYPDLRILEYSGVTSLDKVASGEGTAATASSGSVTTTQPGELLFGACYNFGTTKGAGTGFTQRVLTGDSSNAEDKIVAATGSYSATASVNGGRNNNWVMQLATFYASAGGAIPAAPAGLTASAASSSQINLAWTASTGATSYNVLRSATSGGPYSSIASGVASTSYSNTGLKAGTPYYYVVQAVNSWGTSGNSNQASATTSASSCSTVPNAPAGLAASGTTSSSTTLHWAAVTPPSNCAISSYTVLENGAVIGTTSSTSYPVTGLSASTTYTFTVEATDAQGTSAASSPLSVTTPASTGVTFYVSPSGSNSNPGTSGAPWQTISYAATQAAPGDTVLVGAGTYHESIPITISGTASAPIIFNGQGVAIVDGTGIACCASPSFVADNSFVGGNTQGLFSIGSSSGLSYVTIEGFTIQNYTTTSNAYVPAGIMIAGGGTGIVIDNNIIRHIQNTGATTGKGNNAEYPNAYGIGVFGTSATPLSVTVTNNTVTDCLTGQSETTTFNGNVQNFVFANNLVYNNDNIGMDAIGFENAGPTGADQAADGDVYGNQIYNNSGINNPAYAGSDRGWGQDGLYCDGCTQVVFERNLVYGNDIGIEAASETGGENSSDVIIRNNLIYGSNYAGISVGGYSQSACSGGCGGGGSQNITVINNTLYNNTLGDQNSNGGGGSGEFQIQYRATGILFENNIVYADSTGGVLLYGLASDEGITLNNNNYYTASSSPTFQLNGTAYSSFSSYQSATGQDKNSVFADPRFKTLPVCSATGYTPTGSATPAYKAAACSSLGNTDLTSGSPALNTGTTALGTPSSGWSSYEQSQPFAGSEDYNKNNRVNSTGQINIGAYEQ